jgi:hypothetical protein
MVPPTNTPTDMPTNTPTDSFINLAHAMLVAIGLVYLIIVILFRSLAPSAHHADPGWPHQEAPHPDDRRGDDSGPDPAGTEQQQRPHRGQPGHSLGGQQAHVGQNGGPAVIDGRRRGLLQLRPRSRVKRTILRSRATSAAV